MLYVMNFTYIFKVTNSEKWISRKRWELGQIMPIMTWMHIDNRNRTAQVRFSTPWLWHRFSMSKVYNINISQTVRAMAIVRHMTFAELQFAFEWRHLRMLYSVTLTFNFKVKHYDKHLFKKCTGSGCPLLYMTRLALPRRGVGLVGFLA